MTLIADRYLGPYFRLRRGFQTLDAQVVASLSQTVNEKEGMFGPVFRPEAERDENLALGSA